jgi:hypothetical protein
MAELSAAYEGRPAVIRDPRLGGHFIAERAVLEGSGWLHATGRIRYVQAGDLQDTAGPREERSWSPAERLSIEWLAGQGDTARGERER